MAQIREQMLVPDLYVLTVESVAYKKRLKREKKFSQNKFKKFSTLFDTTFQCGCCYVKKFKFSFFFEHEKTDKKVAHNRPKPFYSTVQPRPQPTAQN